ncbi:MAG: trypsin-like peptidase domain-containing protein [Ruminococcus sp.]|nr:trypsin-like peptidase domain-containing protein [Ruminococcus sp.]
MAKRIISIVITILMLACIAVPAMAASSQNEARDSLISIYTVFVDKSGGFHFNCVPYDEVKTHMAAISAGDWDDELKAITREGGGGTGFFVGKEKENPQFVVSAHHLMDLYMDCGKGELATVLDADDLTIYEGRVKIFGYFDDDDSEELYVVDSDDKKDISILKLAEPTNKRKPLSLLVPTDEMVGDTVYALGFPALSQNEYVDPTKKEGISTVSIKDGIIGKLSIESGAGTNIVEITCDTQHGHSGGPVVTPEGSVVGIDINYVAYTYTQTDDDGNITNIDVEKNQYAVNISEAIDMLKKNNIDYILLDKIEPTEATGETEPVTPTPNNNAWLFIVIGVAAVVVICAVVIVVVLLNKKKKSAPAPAIDNFNNAQPQINAPKAAGYVHSLSIQHRGMRGVKLQPNQSILIGRSKDCAIMFKEGTPGVSGRHCSISFEPDTKEFTVTDLNSSYGTFLQDGTKLTPNVAYKLKAGNRFFLGEKDNLIDLEVE